MKCQAPKLEIAQALRSAPKDRESARAAFLETITPDDMLEADLAVERLLMAAPGAAILINDQQAMRPIFRAFNRWCFSRFVAGFGPARVTTAMIFGESKGKGRHLPGIMDRIRDLRKQLIELDEVAAAMHLGFSGAEDARVRLGAMAAFDAIGAAKDQLTNALAALMLMEQGLQSKQYGQSRRSGAGALTEKHAITFDHVAKEVAFQWRRLFDALPVSNTPDGGFIDLLDALHREGGAGPLKAIPTLMAKLRK